MPRTAQRRMGGVTRRNANRYLWTYRQQAHQTNHLLKESASSSSFLTFWDHNKKFCFIEDGQSQEGKYAADRIHLAPCGQYQLYKLLCGALLQSKGSNWVNNQMREKLVQKLFNMKLPSSIILWIFDYLTRRLQYVRLNGLLSSAIRTNTGAPQGTVLAPFLFSLYTADCRSTEESCPLVKFADDTELVGKISKDERKISNDEDAIYHKQTENFVNWCDKNYLYLNVSKTKEMCIDFRKNQRCPKPVYIKGEAVERVDTYKYLGVVFDSKLNWKENINSVLKKVNSRVYCMRKLHEIIWGKFRYASNFL